MRFLQVSILFIFLGPALISCKKSQQVDDFTLSGNTVQLWAGQDTTISIIGPTASYNAISKNESIARAVIKGNQILITTDLPGSAVIRITDNIGHASELKVVVGSFAGTWRRIERNEPYKTTVEVEGEDPAFAAKLKDRLFKEIAGPLNGNYAIVFRTASSSKGFTEMQGTKIKGEGFFSFKRLTLTLTRFGVADVYKVIPFSNRFVCLQKDFTDDLQKLYPDKVITKVLVKTYLMMDVIPG